MKIALTPAFVAICLLSSTAVDASPIPSQLGTDLVPRHASSSPSDMFSLFVRDPKLYKSTLRDGHGDDGLQKRTDAEGTSQDANAKLVHEKLNNLWATVKEAADSVKQKVSHPKAERLVAMRALVDKLESARDSCSSMLANAEVVDATGKLVTVNLIGDQYPENAARWAQRVEEVNTQIEYLQYDIAALKEALRSEIYKQRIKEEAEGR